MSEPLGETFATSDTIQAAIVAALMGATAAGANVFTARDWPTDADEMPIILVQSPSERKESSSGRSGPASFNVIGTFRIVARVYAKAEAGDAGALAALAAVQVLQRQIERAVINDAGVWALIQQFSSVDVTNTVRKEEFHFGELVMDLGLEFYQPPEAFAAVAADPLDELHVFADLVNVYDPTGDYSDTEEAQLFPGAVVPAPRTSGPDGRPELEAVIVFPDPQLDFSNPDNLIVDVAL